MALFTNQAQLSYNNSVVASNIAVGEILEVLSVTKTALSTSYSRDDTVTYVISLVNSGTLPVTGLTVTDDLGTYTSGGLTLTPLTYVNGSVRYFVDGVLQPAPAVTSGNSLSFANITVPAGGNTIIIYEAEINSFAPLVAGSTIVNAVTAEGGGITPITATETVTAAVSPFLTITKAISPVPVTENGTLTYTFTIANYGNTPVLVTDDAIVTDTFNPILTNVTASFNGTTWVEGTNYTYDETTGLFATLPGQITVPAASYTQDPVTGNWITTPGTATLVVTGTV
ncbi:MAG: hypothetical protein E7388_03265 [Ruminococcaceae bacterium]|nr:hypothetical protein [Oscillospiraceae bacterium]